MLVERLEDKWIDLFARTFDLCNVRPGDAVAILAETASRPANVELAELALLRLGARPFRIIVPTPPQTAPVPVRSTGASTVLADREPVVQVLGAVSMVVDLTVEGLMHSRELPRILKAGSRVLYVSNEHPEILERCAPDPALRDVVRRGVRRLKTARSMRVTSDAGTDLTVAVEGAPCAGGWGAVDSPRQMDHWPGGIVACFPRAGSANGVVVMDVGDINLTFKRYLETPITLSIDNDYVVRVDGVGLDAELMRTYFAAWGDREAYAISHVGWGMNPRARWDAMALYDRGDHNGTEQRVFAGNFLLSTGANEFAGRYTLGHFDLPMRNCTVALDGEVVVNHGVLQGDLA
jgi:2,5-dihydroxypyridine 5,6-dioxygenase